MENHDMSWAAKPERSSADEHCKRVNADEMTPTIPSPISDQAAGEPDAVTHNGKDIMQIWFECDRDIFTFYDRITAPTTGSAPETCKPGGCSAIGCEGGHYCFDANGVARPAGDPSAVARAIFPNGAASPAASVLTASPRPSSEVLPDQ